RKQVQRRRAVKSQVRSVDDRFERRGAASEQDDQLHLARVDLLQRRGQASQLDEPVPLRKREIFLQQPVALERTQRDGQQRLVVGEAHRIDRLGAEQLVR